MDMPAFLDRSTDLSGHLVEERRIGDGMYRVEAQAVEAVFHQPIDGILDEEAADRRLAEIDGRTPWRVTVMAEEARGISTEIVPVRPEMIIDDVEVHHQLALMRAVDECFELLGRAVSPG